MKTATFWIATLTVFGITNGMIARKEAAIRNGTTMLVPLAPRDPRSLMQGDYMALRYEFSDGRGGQATEKRGRLVVRLDDNQVAQFVRLYRGGELADGEYLVRYTRRWNELRIGPSSYFFQEGHAQHYNNARYGELKVARTGESVLVGLRNADLSVAGPP